MRLSKDTKLILAKSLKLLHFDESHSVFLYKNAMLAARWANILSQNPSKTHQRERREKRESYSTA